MRLWIERGGSDRPAEVADIDRLKSGPGRDHRQQGQARHRGEAVGESVLGPEDDARTNDGCPGEGSADRLFALPLGPAIF
jgi:hypothetical protein